MVVATVRPDLVVDFERRPNYLAVRFPWDAQAVSLIKAVPGRRWHKEDKYWSIPSGGLRALQTQAARRGFDVVISQQLKLAQARGQKDKSELRQLKTLDDAELDLPTKTTARPYQRAGIRFLQASLRKFKGTLLADDMGLGKTFQALSLVALSKIQTVLVLCPATVKWVWSEEIAKHYPALSNVVVDGSAAERREQWASGARIIIAGYEIIIPRRRQDEKGKWHVVATPEMVARVRDWDLVICDEAAKLKNYRTATAKTVKKLNRRYSLGLSGKPIENRLEELHSIMDFVMPGLLGPGFLFHQEHCTTNRYGGVIGYKGIEIIRHKIAPHYLRRLKEDVLTELPPKTMNDVWLEMSKKEWRLYEGIKEQILAIIRENPTLKTGNILTEILRLKQCTDDARLLDEEGIPSTKVKALADLLEASEGHKVVVFTQFKKFAKLVAAEFDGLLLDGDVPVPKRPGLIREFQEEDTQLLVCTEAGRYGITLTAADIIVHLDQPWNPATLQQREDRLHRIGQLKNVQVVSFIAKRTIDEYVREIIHRKRELTRAIFQEETDVVVHELTRGDLLALLGEKE